MLLEREIKQLNALNSSNKLIILIVLWNICSAILIGFFNFPRISLYITDLFNMLLFIRAIWKNHGRIKKNPPLMWALIFSIIAIASAMINLSSPIMTVWGIRQNIRYILFFYSCISLMNEDCINQIQKIIEVVFWISLPLCFYEALFVTYSADTIVGDMVGGVFYRCGNAPLNMILFLYVCRTMLNCFENKQKFSSLLLTLAAAFSMAILAELKVFILETIIITIYCAIACKINWKSILIIILGILVLGLIVNWFVEVNARGREYYTADMFSIQNMLDLATRENGYDGHGDLNRLTAVTTLKDKFFDRDIIGLLFGYGIGAADYSKSLDFLTSAFYNRYSYLHYQYFSDAFVFIETGLIGLVSYYMIFISALWKSIFRWKSKKWKNFYVLAVVFMIVMIVYNTTMRNEFCAYMLFAILATPYIKMNRNYSVPQAKTRLK